MRTKIRRQLTNHRVWLDKNGSRIEARELRYLDKDLEEGSPQACQSITDSLNNLATVYGTRGILKIVDATDDGWADISRAIDHWGWSLKIRAEGFFGVPAFKEINLTNQVSRAACLVCCSETWSATAGAILRRVASQPNAVDPLYWAERRFEPFVLTCLESLDGAEPQGISGLKSPYKELFVSVGDNAVLEESLRISCDYHVANMDDTGGDWNPEFKHPPFDLLPCEVMLVNQLRNISGFLPIDGFHHPLV